ncbi:hypothetical protein WH52_03395 [Tenacibaculum holothuriorum]|uniref:Uncharacterized protein n=1 Tax=Tenacibaculum holothuriorum TaxID=1635173 RepID=A0A1Y2PE39_9FLAO|nr:hypothetical protein [Tenacibaculum holothuriorum]OSY88732.1 hypothetical protein WH52_03395 [Tenacibaculum holothuriorum]
MKKTNLLQLFTIILSVTLLVSCGNKKCKCEDEDWQSQIPEGTYCYSDVGRTDEMLNYSEIVNMLKNYDTTRIAPLKKALGYEDTRINNYNFEQFKKYLGRIESLSEKAKIPITGISFISAAKDNYSGTGKSYQDLIYIPTTTIDGKQIPFDPVQSVQQGKLVTFKEMLAKNGYKWIYNTKEDFENNKRNDYNYTVKRVIKNEAGFGIYSVQEELSGAGNRGSLAPPF